MIRHTLSETAAVWTSGDVAAGMPARLYATVVVALAVFLGGLTFWGTPEVGYTVRADVEFPGEAPQFLSVRPESAEAGTIFAREQLRQQIADAIRATSDQLDAAGHSGVHAPVSEAEIQSVEQRLRLTLAEESEAATQLRIELSGVDRDWSIAFVGNFTRGLLVTPARKSDAEVTAQREILAAKWEVEQQHHYERKALYDLEGALTIGLEQLAQDGTLAAGDVGTHSGDDAVTSAVMRTSPQQRLNPQWEQLQEKFTQLGADLTELLKTVTANHPRVRALVAQMDEVRQQLEVTPKYEDRQMVKSQTIAEGMSVGSAAEGDTTRPAGSDQAVAAAVATRFIPSSPSNLVTNDAGGFAALRRGYDQAIRQREEAERDLASLLANRRAEREMGGLLVGRIVRPAMVAQTWGGRPSRWSLLVFGLTALFAGCCISWGGGAYGRCDVLATIDDVQRIVGAPLVGQISIAGTTCRQRHMLVWTRAIRWGTKVGELVLGTLVLLFLWHALAHSSVAEALRDNPLGTFMRTVTSAPGSWF